MSMTCPNPEDRIALLEKEVTELRAMVAQLARRQGWPQYVTSQELAEMLNVSARTVEDWVHAGTIPFHKVGAKTRFLIGEVVEWSARRNPDVKRKGRAARQRPAKGSSCTPQIRGLS